MRFNELSRKIPDISTRVLSVTLKTLEADGLINRKVYAQVPPKVEYTLTETGKSLVPLINAVQSAILDFFDFHSVINKESAVDGSR